MTRRKPVKTIHIGAIAASLDAQNNALMLLVMQVETMLQMGPADLPLRGELRQRVDDVREAFWPSEEGEGA